MVNDRAKITYKGELVKAMHLLAEDPRVIFIGQNTIYPGNSIYAAVADIPIERKIELPVIEDTQLGMSIGLSLMGFIPISFYSRMDFLILAMNQLVNHLDKIEESSGGQFMPKVIIRTVVGSTEPFDPGLQHCQDHTEALRRMLCNVDVIRVQDSCSVVPSYKQALQSPRSTLFVEYEELYN